MSVGELFAIGMCVLSGGGFTLDSIYVSTG